MGKIKKSEKVITFTMGASLVALALAILGSDELSQWVASLPSEYSAYATMVIGILTIVFRFIAGQSNTE